MHYIMNKDIPVVEIETGKFNKNYIHLVPYALQVKRLPSVETIYKWLKDRALPLNRKNSDKIYKALGLSRDNTDIELMFITHSVSINDNYWVADESELEHIKYRDINLFNNSFNKAMYLIALRGDDGYTITDKSLSAEYTGQGTFPKCFVREDDGIYLYKNSSGRAMYNEIVAGQIANVIGFNSVEYKMAELGGIRCTKSKIVSNEQVNWETAASLIDYFKTSEFKIPQEFMLKASTIPYCNMVIFDGLVLNDDRHMKNWAFEFNSSDNSLIGLAPSYDYNNTFIGTKGTMSLLLFDGNRHMSILRAARVAYRDYGTSLDFNNLINYLDSVEIKINVNALKNRIKYIKGEKSNQNDCYEV